MDAVEVSLPSRSGSVPALVYRPDGADGPWPAIVLGVEAYGINTSMRAVAGRLAAAGHVVVVPDYYRGERLDDPDNYLDFTEVVQFINRLDFTTAAHDQLAAIEYAAGLNTVDPERIVVWGYCTGATLSLLAAELSDRVAAAVLFFPSQPRFSALDDRHPVHPVDLLWAVQCPVLLIYGDQDAVMSAADLGALRERATAWGVDLDVRIYPDAGHAFIAPGPPLRNDAADRASWDDALSFLQNRLTPVGSERKKS